MQNPAEQVKKQHTKYKEEKVEYTYRLHHSNKNTRGYISPSISFGTDLFIAAGGGS